jgi:hypothetical protein
MQDRKLARTRLEWPHIAARPFGKLIARRQATWTGRTIFQASQRNIIAATSRIVHAYRAGSGEEVSRQWRSDVASFTADAVRTTALALPLIAVGRCVLHRARRYEPRMPQPIPGHNELRVYFRSRSISLQPRQHARGDKTWAPRSLVWRHL